MAALAVSTALTLASCASTSDGGGAGGSATRTVVFDGTDCFNIRNVRRFEPLNDSNLLVIAEGGRAYHIELVTPTQNLDGGYRIYLQETRENNGRICPSRGESVYIDGPIIEQVPIGRIDRLDDFQADEIRNQFGQLDLEEI